MVSLYFGLPGCGKTTMLAKLAYDAAYKKKSPYKHIYGNIALSGIDKYVQIKSSDLGSYMLIDALILIDEGSLQFDNRDYKNFTKNFVEFFLLHRHFNVDVAIFIQKYDAVDVKIRNIADRVYYLHKSFLTGWYKTIVWRIPYGIMIPSKNDSGSSKYGEIIQGYYKPPVLSRLLTPNLKRKKYYPYFDSWDRPEYPPLPSGRFSSQLAHNIFTLGNVKAHLDNCPRWQFFKRKRLQKLFDDISKTVDNMSVKNDNNGVTAIVPDSGNSVTADIIKSINI